MNKNELRLKQAIGNLLVESLRVEMLAVNNGVGNSGRYESNNPRPIVNGRVLKGNYPGFTSYDIYNDLTTVVTEDGVTINLPDYFIFIEKGRRVGAKQPPKQVILAWMDKNNIGGGTQANKNSIAYAIGRSIKLHGIKARPFIQAGIDGLFTGSFAQFLDEDILKYFDSEIQDLFNRILQ